MRPRKSKRYNKEMLNAMQELYGEARGEKKAEPKPSVAKNAKKVNTTPKEEDEQIRFAVWLDKIGVLYAASANGGSRNRLEALKLKRMGCKAGHPDVFIYEPREPYSGMAIELKRVKGGFLSDNQKYWLEALRKKGYHAIRCNGFEIAKQEVMNYLGMVNEKKL